MHSDAVRRQRFVAALAVALVGCLMLSFGSARAAAAITHSTITAPADPTFLLDQSPGTPPSVTITGTSDGSGGSTDILCYHDNGNTGTSAFKVATTSVSPVGNFSVQVPATALEGNTSQCRLRAVTAGANPTPTSGLGAFAGPRVVTATFASTLYDFILRAPQLSSGAAYSSAGHTGVGPNFLDDPNVFGQSNINTWAAADSLGSPALSNASRPGVLVDAHPAYTPAQADALSPSAAGLLPVSASVTQNASTGDITLTDSEPLVICPGTVYPATGCAAFSPTGVTLTRTVTQGSDGHVIYVTDRWSSTDGSSHAVDVLVSSIQDFGRGSGSNGVGYQFPGQTKFTEPKTAGATVTPVAAVPNSILVDDDATVDGSPVGARGAITYGQAPTGVFTFASSTPDQGFDTPQSFTVPSSGSVPLRFAYSSDFTLANVQADARTAETTLDGAQIAFTSPANGSTTASTPVTVTGTVSSASGTSGVSVNGAPATVSGSTFSAQVPLTTGANTITAVLTTAHGSSASASETVTYAPAPPPPAPPAPPVVTPPSATTGATPTPGFQRATIAGSVTPGTAATTYHFDWGTTAAYGHSTPTVTIPASGTAQAVTAALTGLTPGTTYHYRLVATSGAGSSTGADQSFVTPMVAPQRLTYGARPSRDRRAPFLYTLSGRLLVARGVQCHGSVAVLGTHGRRVVLRGSARLGTNCTYRLHVRLTARQLHGHGTVAFALTYRRATGFKGVPTRRVTVRFG